MMKPVMLWVYLIIMQYAHSQDKFQLAPPMLKYTSGFFSGSTMFEVVFNQPGAEVRYTLNGNEPGENDLLYTSPVRIDKKTTLKARAFGKNFLPSETVMASFIKKGKSVRKATYSKPNDSYASAKQDILIDNVGGIANYRSGTWVGFDSDTVTVDIALQSKEKIQKVLINLLQDENSWIFMPEQILLYYYDAKAKKYISAGHETFSFDAPGSKQCNAREIKPTSTPVSDKLRLVILPVKKIPEWHPGKGQHGWLFIDEINVY